MIPLDEALRRVLEATEALATEVAAPADAIDRALAEDVTSDIDLPPYDKALVDGYAVRSVDFQRRPTSESAASVELEVVEEVTAGRVPTVSVGSGQATRIMTGTPIPAGADAVVMVEHTNWEAVPGVPGGVVRCDDVDVRAEMHLIRRGAVLKRGAVVLRGGTRLGPAGIGLLAEVGRQSVHVVARPRVAVLPTGDELVDASLVPGPGQIRNTNGPMLLAAIRRLGAVPVDLGIGRDDRAQLRGRMAEGLQADVLLVSGGVSAGVLDLVPEVLREMGVVEVFHKVALRPGKPLWFGIGESASRRTLVFGLPGNPVGALVCWRVFVAPALLKLMDVCVADDTIRARLAGDYVQRGNRTTYHPARLRTDGQTAIVETVPWLGSSDLRALAEADAWVIFPAGDRQYRAGEEIACRPL